MNRKTTNTNKVARVLNQIGEGGPLHDASSKGDSQKSEKEGPATNDVPHLEELAKSTYILLMNCELQRTENYWQLGDYLRDIRHQLGLAHGSWQKYLEETLHIDYQRAKRACRLRKQFDKPEKCKGMTLEEALNYQPSPTVTEAKQAGAKCSGRTASRGRRLPPAQLPAVPARSSTQASDR